MSPEIQHLIQEYGYWIIAVAALIEGESILLAGGIAAHMGLLDLKIMICLGVVGSVIHDHLFFFLGRYAGTKLMKRWKSFELKIKNTLDLFERYGSWLILTFRYAYGIRTLIPTVIGMTSVSLKRFFILDVIGGVLWSSTFLVGGYWFGSAFEALMARLSGEGMLGWFIAAMVVAILSLVWLIHQLIFKIKERVILKQEANRVLLDNASHESKKQSLKK